MKSKTFEDRYKDFKNFIKSADSDGCSFVPDFELRNCCEEHDYYYRYQPVSRWVADWRLYRCISFNVRPRTAIVFFIGVRIFGLIPWLKYKRRLKRHER